MKRPLFCKLGLHEWYSNSWFGGGEERCNYCDAVRNQHGMPPEEAREWLDEFLGKRQ